MYFEEPDPRGSVRSKNSFCHPVYLGKFLLIFAPTRSGYSLNHLKVSMSSMTTKYDCEGICETRARQLLYLINTWGAGIKVAADGMYLQGRRGSRSFSGNSSGPLRHRVRGGLLPDQFGSSSHRLTFDCGLRTRVKR